MNRQRQREKVTRLTEERRTHGQTETEREELRRLTKKERRTHGQTETEGKKADRTKTDTRTDKDRERK